MNITIEHRTVYGTDRFYPVCETAKIFAKIAGSSTLTPHAIRAIRELGYDVEYVGKKMP